MLFFALKKTLEWSKSLLRFLPPNKNSPAKFPIPTGVAFPYLLMLFGKPCDRGVLLPTPKAI